MMTALDALVLLASYLLGSIPWSYIVTRLVTGQDIRVTGNGNVGTRNTFRVAGRWPGMLVLVLDVAKGLAAYWVAARWSSGPVALHLAGLAAMLGHWWPVWLGGRGGIGQAVITGFWIGRWPIIAPIAVPVFCIARLLLPQFNLAYAIAALVAVAVVIWRGGTAWDVAYPLGLLLLAVAKKILDGPRQRALLAADGETPEGDVPGGSPSEP
jgi:glycerol-3-phosphate acyltransferase PlsY